MTAAPAAAFGAPPSILLARPESDRPTDRQSRPILATDPPAEHGRRRQWRVHEGCQVTLDQRKITVALWRSVGWSRETLWLGAEEQHAPKKSDERKRSSALACVLIFLYFCQRYGRLFFFFSALNFPVLYNLLNCYPQNADPRNVPPGASPPSPFYATAMPSNGPSNHAASKWSSIRQIKFSRL